MKNKSVSIKHQAAIAVWLMFVLTGCRKAEGIKSETDCYVWTVPDMSEYERFDQRNTEVFRQIDLEQLETILDQKQSVLLLVSSPQCSACQEVINDLAGKAKERGKPLCYINAAEIARDYESYSRFINVMSPVLVEEDGKRKIFTPELVKIDNGGFAGYYIGSDLNGFIEILEGEN